MPQMAPISWLILFTMFSITLILFNVVNYYLISPRAPQFKSTNLKQKSLNWKW